MDGDGKVLIARRPEGKALAGLWEFPGGKVEPGESPEAALIRELKEELDVTVTEDALTPFTFASHAYETAHILLPLFLVSAWIGAPKALAASALAWVRPQELGGRYPMPPADDLFIERLKAWRA
jgi:8-oxo-dGTP diphosphatase